MSVTVLRVNEVTAAVREQHKHLLLATLNHRYCVKAAVNSVPYAWHHHPNSDEVLIVLEGRLVIETREGWHALDAHDVILIPAGVVHRTTPIGRAVNLVVEDTDTETVFLEEGGG